MEYSDTTNGLIQDARFLVGLDISDTAYSSNDLNRNINEWYRRVNAWIWDATGLWEYDDSNWTDLPIATTTMVADQQDYELPTYAQKIIRVEVKDDNGDWFKLDQIDQSEISDAMTEFHEDAGLPIYYDVIGRSLFLYPKPNSTDVTLASGLKIYFSREIVGFNSTATGTEPGFADNFHRILSLGAAYDFALSRGVQDRINTLKGQLAEMKEELQRFYGDRNKDRKVRITPSTEGAWNL